MNNEELILNRLDHLENEIAPVAESARSMRELRDELEPRLNEAVQALIVELADVEADFQVEDLLYLMKKSMRNVRNFTFALDQLKNLIDFALTVEPLLKTTVPEIIIYLNNLEQKGIFNLLPVMIKVTEKLGQAYTAEELEQLGGSLVDLLSVAQKLTTPESMALLEKAAELPAKVDLSQAKPVGFWGLMGRMGDEEVKKGMGVLMELTKGLATLKS
ncbi:DUF1641 domain-containing protein [Desulfococcaceae bacterium HSG9]|nr:DUF1641 domain-containing protein [Desulfococcaceae bacterium HSG9]